MIVILIIVLILIFILYFGLSVFRLYKNTPHYFSKVFNGFDDYEQKENDE